MRIHFNLAVIVFGGDGYFSGYMTSKDILVNKNTSMLLFMTVPCKEQPSSTELNLSQLLSLDTLGQ